MRVQHNITSVQVATIIATASLFAGFTTTITTTIITPMGV